MRSWNGMPWSMRIFIIVSVSGGLALLAWLYVTVQRAF